MLIYLLLEVFNSTMFWEDNSAINIVVLLVGIYLPEKIFHTDEMIFL